MITRVSIRNYKSLEKVDIPLGPLVVLVGANASGKSNILDALTLVKQAAGEVMHPENALSRRGGFSAIVWGGETKRDISIEVTWRPKNKRANRAQISYSIQIGSEKGRCIIKKEEVKVAQQVLARRDSTTSWSHKTTSGTIDADMSALHSWRRLPESEEADFMMNSILGWAFYHFEPRQMRSPQPVRKAYRLSEQGSNLSTVVHTLFSDGDPSFNEIFEVVKSSIPTAEKLLSPITEEGQTYAALKEKSVPSPVGTWGLSDGTLFSLALAVALLTPEVPSLLAVEAPDTELHPYVMENVAEMLKSASRRTQVLTTTHSPYLLNYLPLESLIIVEKINGKTKCKPVRNRRELRKVIEQLGAGKAWYAGHLGGIP